MILLDPSLLQPSGWRFFHKLLCVFNSFFCRDLEEFENEARFGELSSLIRISLLGDSVY